MISRYTLPEMGSIWDEQYRLQVMLDVELAVLDAQSRLGIIPRQAASQIRRRARVNLKRVQQHEAKSKHDVIAFIENLEEHVGPYGCYLHFGLTSSDVLDTSLAILLRQATELLQKDLKQLLSALAFQARKHKQTLIIGRTHGVHAEPTTFGLKIAVFYDEFKRHQKRLERTKEQISIGKISGAVGTFANVDPRVEAAVCRKFNLRPAPISTQIIQRDIHASYMMDLALIAASIEKLATEIRHLQRTEVREVEEPFGKRQKGSSAMPHKKNPITCERMTGLSRLLRGYMIAAMENIALWHERDISHSSVERVILPDATITLDYMLQTMTPLIRQLVVHRDRMKDNLNSTHGVVYSGQVLLALMRKGLSRTAAYELVQRCALKVWQNGGAFTEALQQDAGIRRYLSVGDIRRCVDSRVHLKYVNQIFKRVGL